MSAVRTAARKALVAAAATAALFAGAGSATASTTVPEAPSGNWLYTVVIEGQDVIGPMKGKLLRCPPPRGSRPVASVACRQLNAVDGDISKIKRADVVCPMIYKPVTAMSYGMWDGRRMVFAKNYPNACVMHASTGSVFK
ncbi:SSI family serine proteinase inhibitor [Streptomyces sp. NPDC048442]|uniref:SSI family serine proteinase inhibitor n=1 Tax=Streptomyces sp. NPDC048442 TaxID=3154823 RepID=UPI00342AA649